MSENHPDLCRREGDQLKLDLGLTPSESLLVNAHEADSDELDTVTHAYGATVVLRLPPAVTDFYMRSAKSFVRPVMPTVAIHQSHILIMTGLSSCLMTF